LNNPSIDAGLGEAHAILLAVCLAIFFGCSPLVIEGDSLVTMMAINNPLLVSDWNIKLLISNILLELHFIPVLNVFKKFRWVNFSAHQVAR
jgi:hypothetical protein